MVGSVRDVSLLAPMQKSVAAASSNYYMPERVRLPSTCRQWPEEPSKMKGSELGGSDQEKSLLEKHEA